MSISLAQSQIYGGLFGDAQIEHWFSDAVELRSMLQVEGALAQVQGALGVIPTDAANFIALAAERVQIDPADLGAETARNGVPVPALLTAFRKAAEQPKMMQYLHWGATSQDIMDTGQALRLAQVFDIWQARLTGLLGQLAHHAEIHADLPMAARSYGQIATPTSFGMVVAGWGWPLMAARARLAELRPLVLNVSLSGAAGTLAAMGAQGPAVRAALAQALMLRDPDHSWHSDRAGMGALAGFAATLAASLGKLGEDLILLTQSGLAEVSLGQGGGSSTMPQKQNPIAPSALVALARVVIGQAHILQGAGIHRQQRDGTAWFTEWLILPQICAGLGRIMTLAQTCLTELHPDPVAMQRQMDGGILAEALTFALARHIPRPEAEKQVKTLLAMGQDLQHLVLAAYPDLDWDALVASSLGQAPTEARAFAQKATMPE